MKELFAGLLLLIISPFMAIGAILGFAFYGANLAFQLAYTVTHYCMEPVVLSFFTVRKATDATDKDQ